MLEEGFEPSRLSTNDFESFAAAFTPLEQIVWSISTHYYTPLI